MAHVDTNELESLKGSQWKSGSGIFHGLPPLVTELQFVCVNVRHESAAKQTSYVRAGSVLQSNPATEEP